MFPESAFEKHLAEMKSNKKYRAMFRFLAAICRSRATKHVRLIQL